MDNNFEVHIQPWQQEAACPNCGGCWSKDTVPFYKQPIHAWIKPTGPHCPHCGQTVTIVLDLPVRKDRFKVVTNLLQWHVVDSTLEPEGCDGVGATDPWSVAFFQRNQLGDEICKAKAERLCALLNRKA